MEKPFYLFGQRVRPGTLLAILMMAILTASLAFSVSQNEFAPLIGQYLVLFGLYWALFQGVQSKREIPFLLGAAVALRFLLLFSFPRLSDDIFRFVWDGRLWIAGLNPFAELPSHYTVPGNEVEGLTNALFDRLNSPEYFTVYPPLAQGIFALSAWIAPRNLLGSVAVIKGIVFLFELGNLWLIPRLLKQLKLPARNVLLYALNPLVILELSGNLHFEGIMLFFLLLGLYGLLRGNWWASAIAWALSIATKLLPLMFLPLLVRRLRPVRLLGFLLLLSAILGLLFLPLLPGSNWQHMGSSLDLYFQRFEFNASLYYLLRGAGYWIYGYNPIQTLGPALALLAMALILALALFQRDTSWRSLPEQLLFTISIYLVFATTVHPWYTVLPLAFCLFTRFRYPVLWSALIYLTYINYSYQPYFEPLSVVALEYVLVAGYFLYETGWIPRAKRSASL